MARWTRTTRMPARRLLLALAAIAGPLVIPPGGAAAQEAVPANVLVTNRSGAADAIHGPSVAVDPTNPRRMAIASYEGSALNRCYLGLSSDGGTTWDTTLLVGPGGRYPQAPGVLRCYNPVVAFGPDGTLYYVIQDMFPNDRTGRQLKVYVSRDAGRTFALPVELDGGQSAMRAFWPSIAVDGRTGRVYVAWSHHPGAPAPGRVLVSWSDDRGESFAPPVFVSPPSHVFPAAPQVAVGSDGRVYVAYGSEIENTLHAAVSADGGRTFTPPLLIERLLPNCTFEAGPPRCTLLQASFGPRHFTIVSGRGPGQAFLAFWDPRGPGGLARISFTTTTDGGATWSPHRQVAAPPGREGDHLMRPWLSMAPNGRIDMAFYVRAGLDGPQDVYLASTGTAGTDFGAPRRMNDTSSDSKVGPPAFFGAGVRFGDYVGVASLDEGTVVAWTDTRRGNVEDGRQDIFAATTVPSSLGYRLVAADGGVFGFGGAPFLGSTGGRELNRPIVATAATPTGKGYWFAASDGGVFGFGDARFLGSASALGLRRPITAMAATPSGQGYWLAGEDGAVAAFGDAGTFGNLSAKGLNRPIVGMATTPSGSGYFLVASDGGVFAFGDARYRGSTGSLRLNRPVVGMATTPGGNGYWLVASDGGVFAFGDARFLGSTGSLALNRPVVAMGSTPTGRGYWLVASDGGVFAFGDARFFGSTGALSLNQPIVGITGR